MNGDDDMNVNVGIGTISGTLSGFAIGIGFSMGVCMVTLFFIFAWYFCGGKGPRRINETHTPENSAINIIVGKGLDEATLGQYPNLLYSELAANIKRGHNKNDDDDDNEDDCCCPICLVEYNGSDVVRLLTSCNHIFHQKCIDPWLRLSASCPTCRKSPETPLADQPATAVEQV